MSSSSGPPHNMLPPITTHHSLPPPPPPPPPASLSATPGPASIPPSLPIMTVGHNVGQPPTPNTAGAQNHTSAPHVSARPRPPPPPLDTMRAYRACLNCRGRKSKCDLDINGGRPPCRRCQRENRECILGESHRGGRRVRKKPKLDEDAKTDSSSSPHPPNPTHPSPTPNRSHAPHPSFLPPLSHYDAQSNHPVQPPEFHNRYDSRQEQGFTWQRTPTTTGSDSAFSRQTEQTNIPSPSNDQPYRNRAESTASLLGKPGERGINENIESAELQNPSDALEILARAADQQSDGDSPRSQPTQPNSKRPSSHREPQCSPKMDDYLHYKPVVDGLISPDMIYQLFSDYEEYFHPYFPIPPRETFNQSRIPWLSRAEPHLFSAILTIASKDDERVHQVCYDHMQQLISMILAGADANVEAVEALLLLSQWVSHRPQESTVIGRGEEDRVAWMYIGTALRLGYFLGLDRTAFKSDSHEDPAKYNRKRLVWTACYICDRQVSVRVGKGFWARGPGPLTGLKSSDFPTLQPSPGDEDNLALIFQANLELTQIFSNVHDILYSSKGHGWKEMLEGRYAKYLDDFRSSIRSWNDVWGTMIFSPRLKLSLLLTYHYLRLYVNAFAYQATISRALTYQRDSQHNTNRHIPKINATAPDARFIYESLDAAKSLLDAFNTFAAPETFRYMPSSYYLFIIYSAVFLYKARSTTTMTEDERVGVRRMINLTIERLQRASVGSSHMGSRYARLLQLLWRKSPSHKPPQPNTSSPSHPQPHSSSSHPNHLHIPPSNQNSNSGFQEPNLMGVTGTGPGFSWLDLGATWNFAMQNHNTQGSTGTAASSGGSAGEIEGDMGGVGPGEGFSFDFTLLTDYSLLESDNPNFIF